MKQFDFYRLQPMPGGAPAAVDVVKRGFSWPGFFFAGVWALAKHLWLHGIVLLVVLVPVNLVSYYAAEEGPFWLWALSALVALGVAVLIGWHGNDWRRGRLAREGFKVAEMIEAENAKEALARATEMDAEIKSAAAPKARRVSVGGMVVSGILLLILIGDIGASMRSEVPMLFSMLLTILVPTVALLIRSFRPPLSFLRGLAVVFGGMFLGMSTVGIELSAMGLNYSDQMVDIIFAVIGIPLLWVGFQRVKQKIPEELNQDTEALR